MEIIVCMLLSVAILSLSVSVVNLSMRITRLEECCEKKFQEYDNELDLDDWY